MVFKYYIRNHVRFNSINIDYSIGRGKGNRFRLATKFQINNPKNWINEKQKVRVLKKKVLIMQSILMTISQNLKLTSLKTLINF